MPKYALVFSVALLLFADVFAQPLIKSIDPTSGPIGTVVTISGSNFGINAKENIVYFGSVKATVLSASTSTITVTVPSGSTYQPVTVTTNRFTAYSNKPFNITVTAPDYGITNSSFRSKTDFPSDNYPNFITSGDIDGDGRPDLAILNQNANKVSLVRNTSISGTFGLAPAIDYPAGSHPFSTALGDLDGDGKLDMVIGNYDSSRIIVYKNASSPGIISFINRKEFASGPNPISIGIADIDGDGQPDIVAVNNNGNSVSIFKNISTKDTTTFAPKKDFTVGNWPQRLSIADFNNDGKPDLAVPNFEDSTISVLTNTSTAGTISFAAKMDYKTGNAPFQANAADLDSDGLPEMIVANSSSATISIYKNVSTSGTIAFSEKNDLDAGSTPVFTAINDLDGDGRPDLAVVNFQSSNIYLFRNNSNGNAISFEQPVAFLTGTLPRVATITDLNNDGQPDISFVNSISGTFSVILNNMRPAPIIRSFNPTSGSTDSVIVIAGRGLTGTSAIHIGGIPVKSFTVSSDTLIRAVIGVGATGDVVVTTAYGNAVMPGFTFMIPAPVITNVTPESGPAGTVVTIKGRNFRNISNDPVVYFGAMKASVSNFNDTSLTVTVPVSTSFNPVTVTANSLTAYSPKPFKVTFPGTGNGFKATSFAPKQSFAAGGNPRSVAIADFDGDGKADLFVTNQSTATASILKNISSLKDITFSPKQDLPMETDPFGVATGDFDGDGKIDIAVSNANNGNAGSVSIRRNTSTNANISFGNNITLAVGNGPRGIAVADLNADGKPDILVTAGNSGIIALFQNTSDSISKISFAPPVNIIALQHSDNITLADLDKDGKPEIITSDFGGNTISIWRNISSGGVASFASSISYPAGINPVGIYTADFDSDGKTDIAVANYGSHTVSVFKNNSSPGTISFSDKQDYSTGEYPRAITLSDLDGDGKTDILVSCNTPSAVSVLRNNSTSSVLSFVNRIEYATGIQPPGVTASDLDGDNKPEIIVADDYSNISIMRNRIDEPLIKSFTPAAAETDTSVIINGENLSGTIAISFGGTPASSFSILADTIVSAKVGLGSTGAVQVTTPYGSDTLGLFSYIPPVPFLQTFSPTSGTIGTQVRITGKHLSKITAVQFGSVPASSFTIYGDTAITAIVGKGASGNIIVSGTTGKDTISGFMFIPPLPVITGFTPTAATEGSTIFIKGKNFTWATGVKLGKEDAASFIVKSDSLITAIVGNGKTGVVQVNTEFGTDTLGIFIFLKQDMILAYPNPAKEFITIAHPAMAGLSQVQFIDMHGRIVKTVTIPQNEAQTQISLSDVPPGVYKIVWSDGDRKLIRTIVVRKP